MTFFDAAAAVLSAGWSALNNVVYPGTGISFAGIAVGALAAAISLRIAGHLISAVFYCGPNKTPSKPYGPVVGSHYVPAHGYSTAIVPISKR